MAVQGQKKEMFWKGGKQESLTAEMMLQNSPVIQAFVN